MNLAIDIGNTRMKWALFDGGRMSDHGTAEASQLAEVCRSHDWQRGILCATGACDLDSLGSMAGALHILSSRSRPPAAHGRLFRVGTALLSMPEHALPLTLSTTPAPTVEEPSCPE